MSESSRSRAGDPAKLAQLYPARGGAIPTQLVERLMDAPKVIHSTWKSCQLLARRLDPRDHADLEKIELPDSLHTLVLSRFDKLSEREKTTLRVASVVDGCPRRMAHRLLPRPG